MGTDNQKWVNKFQGLLNSAQQELKKTTQIGMKMVSATHSNSQLHEKMEELGRLALKALKSGELKWESEEAAKLVEEIGQLKEQLKSFEDDVHKIKGDN